MFILSRFYYKNFYKRFITKFYGIDKIVIIYYNYNYYNCYYINRCRCQICSIHRRKCKKCFNKETLLL